MRRRSCDMINSTYSTQNVAVGDDEEVDGGEVSQVVLEERAPILGRWADPRRPVTPHRGVADVDPELVQLGLDARRTPCRIRTPHVADQLPDRRIDSRSTALRPALPTPIGAESLAMPVHNGGWLDEDECPAPARPHSPEPDPEESVTVPEAHAPGLCRRITISCWRRATFSSTRSRRLLTADVMPHRAICSHSPINARSH